MESSLQYIGVGQSTYWDITPGRRLSRTVQTTRVGRTINAAGKVVGGVTSGMDLLAGIDSAMEGEYAEAGYRGVSATGGISALWLAPGPGWAIAGGAFVIDMVKSNRENHWRSWAADHTRKTLEETLLRDLNTREFGSNKGAELRSAWDAGGCDRFK